MIFLKSQQCGIIGNPSGHEKPRSAHRIGVTRLVGGVSDCPASSAQTQSVRERMWPDSWVILCCLRTICVQCSEPSACNGKRCSGSARKCYRLCSAALNSLGVSIAVVGRGIRKTQSDEYRWRHGAQSPVGHRHLHTAAQRCRCDVQARAYSASIDSHGCAQAELSKVVCSCTAFTRACRLYSCDTPMHDQRCPPIRFMHNAAVKSRLPVQVLPSQQRECFPCIDSPISSVQQGRATRWSSGRWPSRRMVGCSWVRIQMLQSLWI
jgi:hypothetical protein